jgi:hypothetical protein
MSAPYYGQPAGPQMGRLVVDSSYNPMAFLLALTGPRVTLNGQPASVKWGQAPFDLPAGTYHLRVSTRYLGDFGPAEVPVTVYPGQLVTVYYRPPVAIGMKGSLGFQPVKTRGMGVFVWIYVVVALVFLISIIVLLTN